MASLRIRIKRKPVKGDFTNTFLENFPLPEKKISIPEDFGILTACSSNLFIGLQFLLSSISHYYNVKILVWNIGLTPEQISWCERQPGVSVKPFVIPEHGKHVKYVGAWFKPHYIVDSPFKNTIWIDSDAMITGNLQELLDLSDKTLFTSDHTESQRFTLNNPLLYHYLPIGKFYHHDIEPYINTGVMVVNKERDALILKDWKHCVEMACSVREIAAYISCWDQGALKWALHKNDLLYLIVPDRKFNYPAKYRQFPFLNAPEVVEKWINNIKTNDPCVINHWMGSPKPWTHWGEMLNLDLTSINCHKEDI